MNLDHDFVQVSKLSEDQKRKVFNKTETLFPPNSGEDQKKKKKELHQKWNTFFSRIQVDTYAHMHTSVKLLGGCRCRPYSKYWKGYSQTIGGGYISPGFRHPCT